jgi:hypothetical protein
MSYDIIQDIRNGALDINSQELFFPLVIKGLLRSLNDSIYIRKLPVPHYIMHTGDDRMFLEQKGYDISKEPEHISNEDWIYSITPKCIVNPGGIDLDTAQLTSPYSTGKCQLEYNDNIIALSGEFRRLPAKLSVDLKYYTDSYTDMMELIQYVTTKLAFIRTYDIVYMGQKIKCSYKIPDSFGEEHTMDIDGTLQDYREHILSLSIEVETNLPVFENRTMVLADKIIITPIANITA